MGKLHPFALTLLALTLTPIAFVRQTSDGPETVVVHNGPVALVLVVHLGTTGFGLFADFAMAKPPGSGDVLSS